ncbi:putative metallo-hydrolase YflN [compost metagenome]
MSKLTTIQTLSQLAFLPRVFPVNCYFVEESDGLTLIDAGMSFSDKKIIQTAAELGKPITRIVLTHAHLDHVGALDRLSKAIPEASIYISERDAALLAGDMSLLPHEPNMPIKGSVPKNVQTKPNILLQAGDRIGSLLAISVPGHTPGSMAFMDSRNGYLIAGDAFQTRGGIAVSGKVQPWFPFPAAATWCKSSALESARKLCELQPTLLAVGHGPMLGQPLAAMRKAIAEAEVSFNKR